MNNSPNEIFLVLISKYSNSCKSIMEKLKFIEPHFNTKIVDVDNVHIRKAIVNATKNQIETVPSIFLIYPQTGQMTKYEREGVLELLDQGVKMVQQKLLQQSEQKIKEEYAPPSRVKKFDDDEEEEVSEGHSSLDEVLGEIDEFGEEDMPQPKKKNRKIGKTNIYPDRRFSPISDDGMIGEVGELPLRGDVDNNIGERDRHMIERNRNYTPQFQTKQDVPKVAVKNGKKNKIVVQDLSSLDDDEDSSLPSTMLEPSDLTLEDIVSPEQGVGRSQETIKRQKSNKETVAQMMAERDALLSNEDQRIRGKRN
jgi:hypothetical protein